MRIYLDASVVAAVVLQEPRWEQFVRVIGQHGDVTFSDFGFGEVVSAIAIRNRTSGAGLAAASETIGDLKGLASDWTPIAVCTQDINIATDLVAEVTHSLRLPDAIHVAVARRIGATLVTADRQQSRAALVLDMPVINLLEQLPL